MTLATAVDSRRITLVAMAALTMFLLFVVAVAPAFAAKVAEEAKPMDEKAKAVEEGARTERVVVAPEPPRWDGWDDHYVNRPWQHRSAPRIRMWVDRGEWSTYRPGDRLWVYFRVDRPCYVTILDYAPDGRVSTIYPSRWSGSTFVHPGRTYRIPESRRYSLRIAGTGGVETLVACAHESPWPSGPGGAWIPRHHPHGGRVVVGRPGGSPPPGWRGRVTVGPVSVTVGPGHWPIPPAWRDYPERWSCDSVSFYVDASVWDDDWYYKDGGWHGGENRDEYWRDRDADYWDDYDRDWNDRYDDRWGDPGRPLVRDRFRMNKCSDDYRVGFDAGRVDGAIDIDCVASSKGDPTEIVGRIRMDDHWGDDVLFRLDVEGEHGERPEYGRVFVRHWGGVRVEVEVTGFGLASTKPWQTPRLKWIEFDVRVFGR
jgi:hypothetical protein